MKTYYKVLYYDKDYPELKYCKIYENKHDIEHQLENGDIRMIGTPLPEFLESIKRALHYCTGTGDAYVVYDIQEM